MREELAASSFPEGLGRALGTPRGWCPDIRPFKTQEKNEPQLQRHLCGRAVGAERVLRRCLSPGTQSHIWASPKGPVPKAA